MLWLKSCPRCTNGDVTLSQDVYGWFIFCLHCGYSKDLDMGPRSSRIRQSIRQRQEEAGREVAQPA